MEQDNKPSEQGQVRVLGYREFLVDRATKKYDASKGQFIRSYGTLLENLVQTVWESDDDPDFCLELESMVRDTYRVLKAHNEKLTETDPLWHRNPNPPSA